MLIKIGQHGLLFAMRSMTQQELMVHVAACNINNFSSLFANHALFFRGESSLNFGTTKRSLEESMFSLKTLPQITVAKDFILQKSGSSNILKSLKECTHLSSSKEYYFKIVFPHTAVTFPNIKLIK